MTERTLEQSEAEVARLTGANSKLELENADLADTVLAIRHRSGDVDRLSEAYLKEQLKAQRKAEALSKVIVEKDKEIAFLKVRQSDKPDAAIAALARAAIGTTLPSPPPTEA